LLLESSPPSWYCPVAPALLFLWLVIATDERPGPPIRVWSAFFLGAASISLLGVVRAPFAKIVVGPNHPWLDQAPAFAACRCRARGDRQGAGDRGGLVQAPDVADPMDTVVYGAAAGLGFAAYENLAYLVQHADIWRSLAALRSVLTVPFHGGLGIIAVPISPSRRPAPRSARTVTIATGRASPAPFWCCLPRSPCIRRSIFRF